MHLHVLNVLGQMNSIKQEWDPLCIYKYPEDTFVNNMHVYGQIIMSTKTIKRTVYD